jgi:hypothetical protein
MNATPPPNLPPVEPPVQEQTGPSGESAPSDGRMLLTSITLEAPLLSVEFARLALRCRESDILDWIRSGDLEWAFDLRSDLSRRSYIRILTESVVLMQQRNRLLTLRERKAQRDHPFEVIFDPMFQHHKPFLLSTELARVWNCGTSHIHNLIQDGLLPVVRKPYALREAFQIPRQRAAEFMKSRRIK